jgi:hypothetical protein
MEEYSRVSPSATFFLLAVLVTAVTASVAVSMWSASRTKPVFEDFKGQIREMVPSFAGPKPNIIQRNEGFAGPARGAGMPDCLTTSADCAQLSEMLSSRQSRTGEGADDVRELNVILSKIACLKRDLLGNAKVVQATRYQPFSTSHDLEPVAETAARCFSRTIPQRDLLLSFDKWGSRGTFLIKRICTSLDLSDEEEEKAIQLFGQAMADLSDIAVAECCNSADAVIGGVPQKRMVEGATPTALNALRPYEGYY